VLATVANDINPGIFIVTVTLTIAGKYRLEVILNDLPVPTQTDVITVTPSPVVSQV
jgi:hypothetical protein